jgi:DNA-binding CsgD family transcriptional regulator
MLLRIQSADRIAGLIETLGTVKFWPHFYRLFNDLLNTKHCSVFAFSPAGGRYSLFAEGRDEHDRRMARALADEYVSGGFERDQNVRRALIPTKEPRTRVNVFTSEASDLKDVTYRRRYYDEPELSGKLVMLANLQSTVYYVNFYRGRSDPTFSQGELQAARVLASLGVKAVARHREMCNADQIPPSSEPSGKTEHALMLDQMRAALLEARAGLTPREAQICAGIMIGQTTLGLSLTLGISMNTVATHRKRAYAKLGITSQNGLFAHYLKHMRHPQRTPFVQAS